MPRWRSSLGLLERLGPNEARVQNSALSASASLLGLAAAVPDFLAPSFRQMSTTTRLYNAVSPPVVLETFDQQDWEPKLNFSSYFSALVPAIADSNNGATSTTSSIDAGIAYIQGQFKDASEDTLATTADELFHSVLLDAERCHSWRQDASCKAASAPPIVLNERFLLCLFKSASAVIRVKGKADKLVTKYLRMVYAHVPVDCFSEPFLARFANKACSASAESALDQLLHIVQQRSAHKTADRDVPKPVNQGSISTLSSTVDSLPLMSCMLHDLMRGFSQIGKSSKVLTCFKMLRTHSLPATVFHYQFKLIALLRICTITFIRAQHIDVEQQSQQMQKLILEIKASMEANSIPLDDNFLATVIFGLSAPLRSPQAVYTTVVQAIGALRLVHTIFDRFATADQGRMLKDMPRLLTALIQAEIDALALNATAQPQDPKKAAERIQRLIEQLRLGQSLTNNVAVGKVGKRAVTELDLSILFLRVRLSAATGEIDEGLALLRHLLQVRPISGPGAAEQLRDLTVKQRSSVILLFSASMQHRSGIAGKDTALEVLRIAFSKNWFDRIWTGTHFPSNPMSRFDPEAYDPDATVMRLWKRWIRAWSIDYWFNGYVAQNNGGEHRGLSIANFHHADKGEGHHGQRAAYRTFSGTHPWRSLKRGLQLLNRVLDQYENRHHAEVTRTAPQNDVSDNDLDKDPGIENRPPTVISRFATLFNEHNAFDNIVKLTLRGGRTNATETSPTHVEKRLSLLSSTLTRVHVPARIWEHFESSLIRHLAMIDKDILPTESVRSTMDLIDLNKRKALLRDQNLLKLWQQAKRQQEQQHPTQTREETEQLPPETGSIFVLRQMLKQRDEKYRRNKAEASLTTRPAFI